MFYTLSMQPDLACVRLDPVFSFRQPNVDSLFQEHAVKPLSLLSPILLAYR
jgi:hypothetical protein